MSTLDAELNDFGAQLAMLGGHAADRDGYAEAARPGTARTRLGDIVSTAEPLIRLPVHAFRFVGELFRTGSLLAAF
jgi:hypothetical protein